MVDYDEVANRVRIETIQADLNELAHIVGLLYVLADERDLARNTPNPASTPSVLKQE